MTHTQQFRRFVVLATVFFLVGCGHFRAHEESDHKSQSSSQETVILIHGLSSRDFWWGVFSARLTDAGYEVLNFPYSTHRKSMDEISEDLKAYIEQNVRTTKYHVVGHSLGNIIARNTFKIGYPYGLERIVMVAPPNHPAQLAEVFKNLSLYRFFFGDCGQKLANEDFYGTLPIPSVEFGIIAGNLGQQVSFCEPNDIIISVESTKLAGMKDWMVLHHDHASIVCWKDTFECCLRFLQAGSFSKNEVGVGG